MVSAAKNKRLHASPLVSCGLQEQHTTKKKSKLDSLPNLFNMRAHISLQWDHNKQMVVAKRHQIGIAWRELRPFLTPLSPFITDLADVCSVPPEIFGLKDVTGVLSCEAWDTHLSELERNLLTKFLPQGPDTKQVVEALLKGENLHFGNPFLKWGASLCSGNFHPDAVLRREQYLKEKVEVKTSYLHSYHNGMVGTRQRLKQIRANCENPERDIFKKTRSSSGKHDGSLSSHANGSRHCVVEENLAATGGSCSSVSDKKVYCIENQRTLINTCGELPQRIECMDKQRSSLTAPKRTKVKRSSRGKEKRRELDGARYMSFFKITKKQHELVKEMIQSGSGIKSTSLNHVLGDIKSFKVQPYEALVEQECRKLHEQWLQLASIDLPSGFTNWKERQSQRQKWRWSLEQELAKKTHVVVDEWQDDEKGNQVSFIEEERDDRETFEETPMEIHKDENGEECHHHYIRWHPLQQNPSADEDLDEGSEVIHNAQHASPVGTKIEEDRNSAQFAVGKEVLVRSATGSGLHRENSRTFQRTNSPNHFHQLNAIDCELGESSHSVIKLKPNCSLPIHLDYAETMSSTGDAVEQEVLVPSGKDAWSEVGLRDPWYHPTPVTPAYTSPRELSLRKPHILRERPDPSIGLESDFLNQNSMGIFLRKPTNILRSGFHRDNIPFFGSYTNHDGSMLLQQLLQVQEIVPCHSHDQKQVGLQLQETSSELLETGHHTEHLLKQKHLLLMQRHQMKERQNYVHDVAHKNIYSGGGRYPNSPQEFFLATTTQNFDFDSDYATSPLQAQSSGWEFSVQNSFPVEHHARGVWSPIDVSSSSSQCLGDATTADGNLFNVVSPFKLYSHPSYCSMGLSEQNVSPRNFFGGVIPSDHDFFPASSHQVDYLECHDAGAPASLKSTNISWMNLPHQSSGLLDSMGKPSLRSLNQ